VTGPRPAAWGYAFDPDSRVWRRPEDAATGFAYSDGDETEQRVAAIVAGATDRSVFSGELQAGITDWPSRYHLTSRRANLLRPFLPSMKAPVLEVGAGMGAVTRSIGESGLETIAVEGSFRRAAIAADRCRDLPQVSVVADTFQAFPNEGEFGSIVLVGVLEYARVHFGGADGVDAVDAMLASIERLLAPEGSLYLAIENQLGLKYLAGYSEDHLGEPMIGVEDRYKPGGVVTFGRHELSERLSAAGLPAQEWWYPMPDYKMPISVVSERAVGSPLDVGVFAANAVAADAQRPPSTTFDLPLAWRTVGRNLLAGELGNSFLVKASRHPAGYGEEIAWHFDTDTTRSHASATSYTFTVSDVRAARFSFERDGRMSPGEEWIVTDESGLALSAPRTTEPIEVAPRLDEQQENPSDSDETGRLAAELAAVTRDLEATRRTLSWRITAPLRALGASRAARALRRSGP
jgi:SAM-dependent methyltransferase